MAQKDYIKRGNPKANTRGRKKTPEPQQQTRPIIAIAIAIACLGGFGYFLWSINGAANQVPQQANTSTKPPTKVVTTKTVDAQPDVPPPPKEEEWVYINELKNKTVDVAITEVEKKGPFLMQCATFKEPRRAEAFKAQLALLGFESRIKISESKYGQRHRVQLGPYETNRDAQRARHKLSKHKINGCKIWLWS